jgi:ferredoxin-thioredoxin reductase catalytic subunit
MTSDLTMENNICEWTTITAPDTIHDWKSSDGQAWLDVLRALIARENCDGYQKCHWSHFSEDETQVFIWTSWAHKNAYDLYAKEDAHCLLYERLDQVPSTPVVTRLIMYDQPTSYARIVFTDRWPSITILYFNQALTEPRWRALEGIHGMTSSPVMEDQMIDSKSTRGVLLRNGHIPNENTPAEAYVFLDHWIDPAREEEIKTRYGDVYRVPPHATQSLSKWFADNVPAEGCLKVEIWHMRYRELCAQSIDWYPTEVLSAPSLEFNMESGREREAARIKRVTMRNSRRHRVEKFERAL